MKYQLGAMCAAVLAAAGAANGFVIMQTQNFGVVNNVPAYTDSVTFNKFGGALSDLISIKVKLTFDVAGGAIGVDNESPEPANVIATFGANAMISSADVTLLDVAFQPVAPTVSAVNNYVFNLGPDDGDSPNQWDAGGADSDLQNGVPASAMSMGFINPLFFAGFVGAGTFDIDVMTNQILTLSQQSGVSTTFSPLNGQGNVMVIYEFIPAPGAMMLLGLGGLVAVRRRR
ncbi:MAG: choice-of-anchor E domain-containing protein [Phycisphaeraceae bacterium]|nr:choice-of-anchor E domain-containing protein [Phycisphaeraceae bacterium]